MYKAISMWDGLNMVTLASCFANWFPSSNLSVLWYLYYSCVFIAIDRYQAVARPLQGGFGRSRLKRIILVIWVSAVFVNVPFLYGFNLKQGNWGFQHLFGVVVSERRTQLSGENNQ